MATTAAREPTLADRYEIHAGTVFLTGVQALVRLPMELHRADRARGLRTGTLLSGYPGSPLAGFDLEVARQAELIREHGIVHRPAVNEELGATAVYGSQIATTRPDARLDGVVGLWYGKAPGVDRATDAFRHANLIGVAPHGGVLAACGDDAISKSSTLPSLVETALFDVSMPILSPGDVQEVLDLGLHGIAMSRAAGVWVGMKLATNVADGSGTVNVAPGRVAPVLPELEVDGVPYVHDVDPAAFGTPRILDLEHNLQTVRLELARRYVAANGLNRVVAASADDRLGVVAAGKTFLDVQEALRRLGVDDPSAFGLRLLKVSVPFPLEAGAVRDFARGLREVVVIEEKRAFLELLVKDVLQGRAGMPPVLGRRDDEDRPLVPAERELDPDAIARVLGPRLLALADAPAIRARLAQLDAAAAAGAVLPMAPRAPYFCSGCPHNTAIKAPDGALIGGGIGCHAMISLMPRQQVGDLIGLTQMGGEGAQWVGMAPFVEGDHLFQNLGDGTFAHSGSLAIRDAVAAGVNITYKLLHNSAVAMTGGQHAQGTRPVPAVVEGLLAEGVARVIVTTEEPERYDGVTLAGGTRVLDRSRIVEAQEELMAVPGVTVLLHDQECAAEKRRARKRGRATEPARKVFINERVCEGCGDCGRKSNCLSVRPVETELGRKTQVHQPSCNRDETCLDGDCPSFLTVLPGKARKRRSAPALPAAALPEPELCVPDDHFAMRIVGIGGSGVVTVGQVLGTAAMLEGRFVRGLDQTGLAQKGGPVTSDLQFATDSVSRPGKLPAASCDLYLGCDLLVAAEARSLAVADPQRTVAVVSTAEVPTGSMVVDETASFPPLDGVLGRIDGRTRSAANVRCDAQALAEELFGSDQMANFLLVGAAVQAGALPLRGESVERAIALNGAAVEANVQAFRRGRQLVADPEALEAARVALRPAPAPAPALTGAARAIVESVGAPAEGRLRERLAFRVRDLIAYQDERYARTYAAFVRRVLEAERSVSEETALTEAVAFHLHKLMAYKDEYEVARLHRDPELRRRVEAEFGTGARVQWRLHPPLLRELGMRRKLALGEWFEPGFCVLQAGRRLRGTRLDPFGRAAVRRVERGLITEYRALVETALAHFDAERLPLAVEAAELPDVVRGYEDIKLANVERFRARAAELRAELTSHPTKGTHAALLP